MASKQYLMASKQYLAAAIATLAFVLPAVAMATEYTVGDDKGWTTNFDYEAWAKDKVFHVGDKLVFKYNRGAHNVFRVNGTAFKDCTIPPANEALTSGNDVIPLTTLGRKWYICGVSDHCANSGQKIAITVKQEWVSPAPAPAPGRGPSTPATPSTPSTLSTPTTPNTTPAQSPSSAYGISVSGYQLPIAAMLAVAFLAL